MANIELAKEGYLNKEYVKALEYLDATNQYPHNLGEGKLYGAQENDVAYLRGLVYEKMGDADTAKHYFEQATVGISEPVQAIFYNDPQPDKLFYQGLAWLKLNQKVKAESIFNRLIAFGESHKNDTIKIDYFAVSLPDLLVFDADLNEKNRIHCSYLIALGKLGLGLYEEAKELFESILQKNNNHNGAKVHWNMVNLLLSVDRN